MRQIVALLGLALLLPCACTKNSATTEPIARTLNLAYLAQPQVGMIHIALEKGYFAAEGLTVKAHEFEFGKLALASVIKGESDLSISAETPVVFAILDGEQLGMAAAIGTWDKNLAVIANRSAGVQKPADLAGKAIGVTVGTSGDFFLDMFMRARDIDPNGITLVDMQPSAMLEAIRTGRIAAAVTWVPVRLDIVEKLGEQAIVFFGDDFYTEHVVITGKMGFMKENTAAMQAFIRAILRAESFMKTHPDEAVSIISKYSNVSGSGVRSVLDLLRMHVSLDPALLIQLEDETRWALRSPAYAKLGRPNWLDYLYTDAFNVVAPNRVRLIR